MNASPDIVVVGSGPAGVSAAWPLVHAGLRVLMLDASKAPPPASPSSPGLTAFNADPQRWRSAFGDRLEGLAQGGDISPKFATPLARSTLAGFGDRLDLEGFAAVGSLGQGGLSTIWGALAAPFTAEDMAGFPFPAEVLQPHYRAVAERIGVAAGAPTHPAAQTMLERHRPSPDFSLAAAPNALRQESCTRCGLCLYGCGLGAIYNAAGELPALRRHMNFDYRPGARVRGLRREASLQVIELDGGERIAAPMVALAAGTIGSSALALARLNRFGEPVRLLSNPTAATAFLDLSRIGQQLPERTVSLGQLFFRLGRTNASAGVVYGAEGLPASLVASRLPLSRPAALRLARALAPALLPATCYLPGDYSDNSLAVDEQGRVAIRGRRSPAADARLHADVAKLKAQMRRLGVTPLPGATTLLEPGADAHYAGTLPMGSEAGTSLDGELYGAPGVFVVDGAALPALPAVHLTFTVMANAARIGEAIALRHRRDAAA